MPTKQIELILQPKQLDIGRLFFANGQNAATWIGAGGARSGGKSGGLRRIMLERRQQRPGTKGVIVRRTWPDIRRNHVEMFMSEWPEMRNMWQEGKQVFTLPNSSTISFMYAENQKEVDQKFWGPEFYDIMIDQAEQFSEQELITIKTCNRAPGAGLGECKMGLFFNPGGVGTEFLRRVFWHKRFNANERPSDYSFVHLFGWDNYVWFEPLGIKAKELYDLPAMCDGTEGTEKCCRFHLFVQRTAEGRKLDALPPTLRAGHLLGSFESFAGQYFAGVWDESKLILTARQQEVLIQPWWSKWLSHDDGFVHHAAVMWWTSGKVNPKLFKEVFGVEIPEAVTVCVVYRCHVVNETEQGQLIRDIRAMTSLEEARTITRYFLSVDAWEKDSKGHSTADTINEELKRPYPVTVAGRDMMWSLPGAEQADNARVGGWRFLYAMMKKTADVLAGKMNPTRSDEDYEASGGGYSLGTPLLFIAGQCMEIIESVPLAIRDNVHPGRSEDVLKTPTKADDVLDSLRYGAKSMLNARQTPHRVFAAERRSDLEQSGRTMTEIAIQLKKLEVESKRHRRRRSSWVR